MDKKKMLGLAYGAGALAMVAVGALVGTEAALLGSTVGQMASNVSSNFSAMADLLSGGSYLAGAGFGIKSAMAFKMHAEDARQHKLSTAMVLALVSGSLLALPTFLSTGSDTMFGQGAQQNSLSGGVLH